MNKKKKVLLMIVVLPAMAFLAVQLVSGLGRRGQQRRFDATEREFKGTLQNGQFVGVSEKAALVGAVESAVEAANARAEGSLNRDQSLTLASRIRGLIAAYSDGTFEAFASFRLPAEINRPENYDPTYVKHLRDSIGQLMQSASNAVDISHLGPAPDYQRATTDELLRTCYNLWSAAGATWTNPVYCSTCWKEIDLDELEVVVLSQSGRPKPVVAVFGATNMLGALIKPQNETIHPSVKELVRNGAGVTVANVKIVVRSTTPSEVVPIFVQFYWVPTFGDWIPHEFVNGYQSSQQFHLFDL